MLLNLISVLCLLPSAILLQTSSSIEKMGGNGKLRTLLVCSSACACAPGQEEGFLALAL